jgi:sugar lactone lactonase YvrE
LGQLEEPSGVAISPDGRLYVAEYWNRRVSAFGLDGIAQFEFDVRGWYEDLGNRPYLAVDPARNLLYVTDPDAGRVLVYDTQGNCVGSFGQPSDQVTDNSQFNTVGGITVDAAGYVYVSDSTAGRVLRFAPFLETGATLPLPEATGEVTAETSAEMTAEETPEATVESAG